MWKGWLRGFGVVLLSVGTSACGDEASDTETPTPNRDVRSGPLLLSDFDESELTSFCRLFKGPATDTNELYLFAQMRCYVDGQANRPASSDSCEAYASDCLADLAQREEVVLYGCEDAQRERLADSCEVGAEDYVACVFDYVEAMEGALAGLNCSNVAERHAAIVSSLSDCQRLAPKCSLLNF